MMDPTEVRMGPPVIIMSPKSYHDDAGCYHSDYGSYYGDIESYHSVYGFYYGDDESCHDNVSSHGDDESYQGDVVSYNGDPGSYLGDAASTTVMCDLTVVILVLFFHNCFWDLMDSVQKLIPPLSIKFLCGNIAKS